MDEIQRYEHPRTYLGVAEGMRRWMSDALEKYESIPQEEREAMRKRADEAEKAFIDRNILKAMSLSWLLGGMDDTLTGQMREMVLKDRDRALLNAYYGRDARFFTGDSPWDKPT